MKIFYSTLLLAMAFPAFGQQQDIQKQLIQRQQQSDAFTLQLRQSQEMIRVSPERRPEIESRQFVERQRFDNLSEKQLREVRPDTPQELRPQERQKSDQERRWIISPQ